MESVRLGRPDRRAGDALPARPGGDVAGDVGRLTQFEVAESFEEAAQNPGGTAGIGVGLGAGMAMAQAMLNGTPLQQRGPAAAASKFCVECGKPVPAGAKFCPDCGKQQ